jgi:hypothetical protein
MFKGWASYIFLSLADIMSGVSGIIEGEDIVRGAALGAPLFWCCMKATLDQSEETGITKDWIDLIRKLETSTHNTCLLISDKPSFER